MLLYGQYTISANLQSDAVLPPYKGSTFRGAFGNCLKRATCAIRRNECYDCLLVSRCLYARLFERKSWQEKGGQRVAAPPHPYIIQPPMTEKCRFSAGEPFDFNLILFGEMNRYLPYFVYAFQQMGEQGIGKRVEGGRGTFAVTGVRCGGAELFEPDTNRLLPLPEPERLQLEPVLPDERGLSLKLTLLTPLRFKQENHLQDSLDFQQLVRGMLRRVSGLCNAWGDGEPELDYRGLIQRAGGVKVTDGRVYWHEWGRYSNRQEQGMNFGGLLGTVTFSGRLAEYLPLLKLCERLHIGKQTTFGLGRFTVTELPV